MKTKHLTDDEVEHRQRIKNTNAFVAQIWQRGNMGLDIEHWIIIIAMYALIVVADVK